MEPILSLKILSDQELIRNLKTLIAKEREILTDIIHHLKEVDARKIHLAQGYSSLFAYLTEGLGYSESAAYRRIQAMRLIQSVPEVEQKLERGDLSLSVASQLQTFIQNEDKRRKAEKLFPITREEKQTLIAQVQGSSARDCEQRLAVLSPEVCLPREKIRPISEDKFVIQFAAGKGLIKKIQKLKSLWSHQNPEGNLGTLFERLVDMALEKSDPERKKEKARQAVPASEAKLSLGRNIPRPLRAKIWRRDQGRCQFKNPRTGRLCHSTHALELDHRYPVSLGGENSEANLRLYCRCHNQYRQNLLEGG